MLAKTYGRLIAWDPVNQKEVWRVERAGQANGGALATAGGLVFQGTGSGTFTALDAASGKELWSTGTQTGVIAAPMTYEIDGEQYVAIMAGTGSSWALIGGDTNMKGFEQRNVSRLLVYKLGGTVQLPPAPEKVVLPMNPPPATAAADVVGKGGDLYGAYCANCHGPVRHPARHPARPASHADAAVGRELAERGDRWRAPAERHGVVRQRDDG